MAFMFNHKTLITDGKVRRKVGITKDREFKVVNFNAVGVDVSPKEFQVCVPSDRDEKCNRMFAVYTKDLHELSSWLRKCGIDTVVMESTGVYWLPLFRVLKEDGFDVMLVNPKDAKNYAGKNTASEMMDGPFIGELWSVMRLLEAENMMTFRTKLLNVFAVNEDNVWFTPEKARS